MLLALVVFAAGAASGWYYWQRHKTAVAATPPQPIYVVIKPFVVTTLDDNQTTRFVQVGVDLEVADKEAKARVEQALPAIQDAIRLQILQSKVAEVTSPQGVEQLRKLLIAQANSTV
ncbi:MAG: flagellar basal body-associated FliL family protein, partial [Stellaceae bacterium]